MSRRDVSKREKLRTEEEELDKQLKDAGFDVKDEGFQEKKDILAMLVESRRCAQQEENQRKQEELIFNKTLDESFSRKTEAEMMTTETADEVSQNNVEAKDPVIPDITSSDKVDMDCVLDSDSSTPDHLPLPSESPVKVRINQVQSPLKSSPFKSQEVLQSPRHSEDLFLFSQTSTKLGVDENVIQGCIETIRVSESESDEEIMPSPPLRNCSSPNVRSRTPIQKISSGVVDSVKSPRGSLGGSAKSSAVTPRPSLRKYSSTDMVTLPSNRSQGTEDPDGEVQSSSQPFSLAKRMRLNEDLVGVGVGDVVSPIIGQRKVISPSSKVLLPKNKTAGIQDAEVSNSLSIKPIPMDLPDLISEDNYTDGKVHRSSESHIVFKNKMEEFLSSPEPKMLNGDLAPTRMTRGKMARPTPNIGTNTRSEDSEQLTTSLGRGLLRKDVRPVINPDFQSLNLSDSDDDLFLRDRKDGKKDINVFGVVEDAIPLKKKLEKREDPAKAYFRNANESSVVAYQRILSLMEETFIDIENYQMTLPGRLPWLAPIKVDRRVKDSLDHPKSLIRGQADVPPTTIEREAVRRVTRTTQQKISSILEEDDPNSEESLPNPNSDNGDWFDARKRSATKRKAIPVGLSRKHAKYSPNVGKDGRKQVYFTDNIVSKDESDLEEFDMPPLRANRTPSGSKREGAATLIKDLDVDNRVLSPGLKKEENTSNFDMGDILGCSQECESSPRRNDAKVIPSKEATSVTVPLSTNEIDCQPSTSGLKYPLKRPRKTFKLKFDDDDDSLQNSEASSSTSIDRSDRHCLVLSNSTQNTVAFSQGDTDEGSTENCTSSESKYFSKGKKDTGSIVSASNQVVGNHAIIKSKVEEAPLGVPSSSTSASLSNMPKRGRGNPVQLKPGPLRFKGKRVRGNTTADVTNQWDSDDEVSLSSTSEAPQQQILERRNMKVVEKKEEEIECPLCQKSFPITVIEAHASNCGEPMLEVTQQPAAVQNKGKRRFNHSDEDNIQSVGSSDDEVRVAKVTMPRNRNRDRERTPPSFERCMLCKGVFKEGDLYLIHVQECQRKHTAMDNISSPTSRTPSRGESSHNPSRVVSTSSITRTQVTQSTSVFERLEGVSEIQFHQGDIRDTIYRDPTTALAHIVNCVAVRPHGLSELMANTFPYSNSYKKRTPIDKLNRARVEDRGVPGTIRICRSQTCQQSPIIINVLGQFYMGKGYEHNIMSKKLVSQLNPNRNPKYSDLHLLKGVQEDTKRNRAQWFQKSLKELADAIPKEGIKRIVFPHKIGCGLAGGDWEQDYYPTIQEFNSYVSNKYGVQVIIIKPTAIAVEGTRRLSMSSKGKHSPKTGNSHSRRSV